MFHKLSVISHSPILIHPSLGPHQTLLIRRPFKDPSTSLPQNSEFTNVRRRRQDDG
jgi:hypothetical protein